MSRKQLYRLQRRKAEGIRARSRLQWGAKRQRFHQAVEQLRRRAEKSHSGRGQANLSGHREGAEAGKTPQDGDMRTLKRWHQRYALLLRADALEDYGLGEETTTRILTSSPSLNSFILICLPTCNEQLHGTSMIWKPPKSNTCWHRTPTNACKTDNQRHPHGQETRLKAHSEQKE
ncbi:MAG: hypothetical protein U0694_07670 [Anaerolineae bacterium]